MYNGQDGMLLLFKLLLEYRLTFITPCLLFVDVENIVRYILKFDNVLINHVHMINNSAYCAIYKFIQWLFIKLFIRAVNR